MDKITDALNYAKTLVNTPYRWWNENEEILPDDKFWASNTPKISSEDIKNEDKSIVCTGLINLIRRHVELSIPGLDGKQGKYGKKFPGTTYTWFRYLRRKKRLEQVDLKKKYPIGTLLIADYVSVNDQGHVAIIIDDTGDNIKMQNILNSCSDYSYEESKNMNNVGKTGIQSLESTLEWFKVTHICLPEKWILKD